MLKTFFFFPFMQIDFLYTMVYMVKWRWVGVRVWGGACTQQAQSSEMHPLMRLAEWCT